MKHSIYSLIDPRVNEPFYVGATKHSLECRLQAHIRFMPSSKNNDLFSVKRTSLIRSIFNMELMPSIQLLEQTTTNEVDQREQFYYEKLKAEGYTLLQHPSFFKSSGTKGSQNGIYAISLKLDLELEEPLKLLARLNNRTVNEEINVAVENHVTKK